MKLIKLTAALALATAGFSVSANELAVGVGGSSAAAVSGPLPNAPTDPTFNYANGAPFAAQGLYRHALNAPATNTLVGAIPAGTGSVDLLVGIDNRPDGSLVALAGFNTATPAARLVTVSTTTGALTTLGNLTGTTGIPIGLAANPRTGSLIVGAFDLTAGTGGTRFYNVTATGAATQIGTVVSSPNIIIELSMNCAGELFGINATTDQLVRVNTATGAVTPASGLIGFDVATFVNGNGADFDNSTGELYAFLTSGAGNPATITGSLYGTVNLTTGVLTGTSLGNTIGALATPSACPVLANITPARPTGPIALASSPANNSASTALVFNNSGTSAGSVTCTVEPANPAITLNPATINVPAGGSASTQLTVTGAPGSTISGTVVCRTDTTVLATYAVTGQISAVTQINTLSGLGLAALLLGLIGFGAFAARRYS